MKHATWVSLLLIFWVLAVPGVGNAYDFSHSPYGDVGCDYCHFVYLNQMLPGDIPYTPVNLDDTVVNNLCRSCHNDLSAPYVQPHSSLTTSNQYGDWAVECLTCHRPHAKYVYSGTCTSADPFSLSTTGAGWTPDAFKGLTLVPNVNQPDYRYTIVGNTANMLLVADPIDLRYVIAGETFGIFSREMVLDVVSTPNSGNRPVTYLATTGANSQADGDAVFDGICEVCHTQTDHFRNDGLGPDPLHGNLGVQGGAGDECTRCHMHKNGFAHRGGRGDGCAACHPGVGSPSHTVHLVAVFQDCDRCHKAGDYPFFASGTDSNGDGLYDLNETDVCENCHTDGLGGPANVGGYKADWAASTLDIGCDGCHDGRPGLDASVMSTNGHQRLVGTGWIYQYTCYYCHADSVDASSNLLAKHGNGTPDVVMAPRWAIAGRPAPSYDHTTSTCANVYCHSDGAAAPVQVSEIAWTRTDPLSCNECHGHPTGDCTTCHTGGVPGWTVEDNWKAAMPMYANGGPGTATANSHWRHLMSGFSCEACHTNTVVGACGTCHADGIPAGQMSAVAQVDAAFHVNKEREVKFAAAGSYDKVSKICATTECHLSGDPAWGADAGGQVNCLACHGTSNADIDDFQPFNGVRGRINLEQWATTGHGRPATSGNYNSGNFAANLQGNPCVYCHDSAVLHATPENPFRLTMHPEFDAHFQTQCAYCHMEGKDYECLGCHNDATSLAPQLVNITYPEFTQDHWAYAGGRTSCLTAGCHPDDANRHKTGAGVWSAAAKYDIRIQYQMVGVCLKCHDEDRFEATCQDPGGGGPVCTDCHASDPRERCQECHTGSQYVLGYDPGPGLVQGTTRASTNHFGYKHANALSDSLVTELAAGTASVTSESKLKLTDASKTWTSNQWTGYSVRVTGGANSGQIRAITANTANTLTVSAPFLSLVAQTDTYAIVDAVWRGGKFCWDCHDPHGDTNLFMVHEAVSSETDGAFGIPKAQVPVTFTNAQSGLDYVRTAAPYTGICNACHTDVGHYTATSGDSHMAGRVCTSCHSHDFGTSHAADKRCDACHASKPPIAHEGFAQVRGCTQCHDVAIGLRKDIMGEMTGSSHHVQGVTVSGSHCYACHWEATPGGVMDPNFHEGFNDRDHTAVPDANVDLVVWGPGVRPPAAVEGTDPAIFEPGDTLLRFTANQLGTAAERGAVSNLTAHCLSCHSDQNNDTDPFGDCKTPRQYAWDRSSIAARYSDLGTATWGKYAGVANAAPKAVVKAFSAHGNAVANAGGWDPATGLDGAIPNLRDGTENVQCFDCHNSHGSKTGGTTSSYLTFGNTFGGAIVKDTQAGKGGYGMTYRAQAVTTGINPMGAGADLCFDCHVTAVAGSTPWGYKSTYGAASPIMGYWDEPRFGDAPNAMKGHFPYRAGKAVQGGHLKRSTVTALTGQVQGQINGLCTGCHDPHGVTPSLKAADRAYAVPLLKGTWLTSPYKVDTPTLAWSQALPTAATVIADRGPTAGDPPLGYHLDQDTFGSGTWIAESDQQFAGLCLRCHPKDQLTDGLNQNTLWQGVDRLHESVKGWGKNEAHNYPCSKCHQPHASGLPRLMLTNCLDAKHQGLVTSGGSFPVYSSGSTTTPYRRLYLGTYGGKAPQGARQPFLATCHESPTTGGGSWGSSSLYLYPATQKWNKVTQW